MIHDNCKISLKKKKSEKTLNKKGREKRRRKKKEKKGGGGGVENGEEYSHQISCQEIQRVSK